MNNVAKISDWVYDEKLLRAKDLSKIFINIRQSTYDEWYKKGFIHRYRIGGSVFYKLSEVKDLIERSKE